MPVDAISAASSASQRQLRVGANTAAAPAPDSFADLMAQASANPMAAPPVTAPAAGSTPLTPDQVRILNAQISAKANVTVGGHRGTINSGMRAANLQPIHPASRVFPVPQRQALNVPLSAASSAALAASLQHPASTVAGLAGGR